MRSVPPSTWLGSPVAGDYNRLSIALISVCGYAVTTDPGADRSRPAWPFPRRKGATALDRGFENPVFSNQIFILQDQFLVDRFGDMPAGEANPFQSAQPQTR
jgi:hypothetical protein